MSNMTQKQLSTAVAAVKSGKLSYRTAAREHGVPKSTVRDHVTDVVGDGATPGRKNA